MAISARELLYCKGMKPSGDIKIKVLPRKSEKPKKEFAAAPPRMIIYVGTLAIGLLAFCLLSPKTHPRSAAVRQTGVSTQASSAPNDKISESIHEHMLESEAKEALLVQQRQVENLQFKDAAKSMNDDTIALQDNSGYGVQLDQEDTADRVYEDLHGEPSRYADFLPGDKISARLANRQWVNEQERAERIAFVSNFIKSAYDRGYEVDIDSNLVVTGVHPIAANKKVNISQILDKLAHQGI